ncbi:MAG: glycosyltransferase family 2 protein [Candidatus Methanoperedens sp.]|nr:glycosyltransferase family 2 protein [Candidatus Methanoperedens sp.]
MKLSLVIPAYQEEKRISRVVDSYSDSFGKKYDFELIVICDGNDNTAEIVRSRMLNDSHIRLLEFPARLGKGGAILAGFKEARGDLVGFVDSDESVSPSDFEKLINSLNGADCAIASRRVEGSRIVFHQPLKRKVSSIVFNLIVNLMFDIGIKDTQCGAKVFKKRVVQTILPVMRTNGFEFDVELLWRIKGEGFRIKEVPVEWKHEEGSTFSLKYSASMFLNLLKVRLL